MANSAHTTVQVADQIQLGPIGRNMTRRCTITFGADYAAAVLPLITADELGLSQVTRVIVEGAAHGTAAGAGVEAVIDTVGPGTNFTLKLWNGTTAIGTVDEHLTTVDLTVFGW